MSESSRNHGPRKCPICGHEELRRRFVSESYEYGGNGEMVIVETRDVPLDDCLNCGETFSGPEAARIRHDALGKALRLLEPTEIRALRERLGKSVDEFSRLIGVRRDQLSQWEAGTLWQDLAADHLMRLLDADIQNVRTLESVVASGSQHLTGSVVEPLASRSAEKGPSKVMARYGTAARLFHSRNPADHPRLSAESGESPNEP
jgi:putative zinc finger/helix-turn-helix YgiT family protein